MRARSTRRAATILACSFLFWVAFGSAANAQTGPEVDLHDLAWFVHADLINPGAGEDLAYWTAVIEDAVERGNRLLVGRNGPSDNACCTELGSSVSVATFGSPGDGLDVIENPTEQSQIAAWGGGGSRAFLVDSLTWCNGSAPSAIGCALRPPCSANANDDPNLWMMVTVESFEDGTLPSVIVHERGHNACLQHVSTPKCALMQATVFTPGLAGCLTETECSRMRSARTETSSGRSCSCHELAGGPREDGAKCDEAGGVCSGGCCSSAAGDAGVHLLAAADPGDASLAPEDMLRVSGYTGDWTNLGQVSPTADDVRALAYSTDADIVYGIVPTVGDDRVITIDPTTGLSTATVGSIANGTDEFVSLAYDPGPTASPTDDRLIGLEVSTSDSGELRWIDPNAPNAAPLLGGLGWTPASFFSSLAFDPTLDRLFFATPFGPHGMWQLDMTNCPPACSPSQFPGDGPFWTGAAMSWSADTGMLYVVGTSFTAPGTRTFYDVVDPVTGTTVQTLSLDRFTPAGLASVPEPGFGVGLLVGSGLLAGLRKSRRP